MKLSEKIFVALFVIGFLMKLAYLEGGGFFIGISISLLSLLYFALGFLLFNSITFKQLFKGQGFKQVSAWRVIGSVGAGIIFTIALYGIMFTFLKLEGAGFMLMTGLSSVAIVLAIVLFKFLQNRKELFYQNMLIRSASIFAVALLVYIF